MNSDKSLKISVIIPAYNYGNYLAECLDSVIAQSFKDWECIVVDNGSTDNTKSVVEAYVLKDKRIQYHQTEQKGVSFARNKAVELSKAEYILPLDADDKIAPTYLEKALKIITEKKDVKVVYSDAQLFGASSGKWILPEFSLKNLLIENSIFCTALFRKSDFELAGGFNKEMKEGFEDWDFWISMLKNGGNVYKINEVLFFYRIKPASRNSLSYEKQLNLRKKIAANHSDIYSKLFSLPELIFDYHSLEKELNSIKTSADLKAGKLLLSPLRWLRGIFKN